MHALGVDCCCEDGSHEAECFASALRALGNRGFRFFMMSEGLKIAVTAVTGITDLLPQNSAKIS